MSTTPPDDCVRYVSEALRLYRATPTVLGRIRQADRVLARQFYDQGVPLYVLSNAFVIGAARRVLHNGFSTPMPPIRSLHYFLPVVREILDRPLGYREIGHLARQLSARGAAW